MFCLKPPRRLSRTESGVTAIEYAIIASLIAVVIIGAVSMVGQILEILYTAKSFFDFAHRLKVCC